MAQKGALRQGEFSIMNGGISERDVALIDGRSAPSWRGVSDAKSDVVGSMDYSSAGAIRALTQKMRRIEASTQTGKKIVRTPASVALTALLRAEAQAAGTVAPRPAQGGLSDELSPDTKSAAALMTSEAEAFFENKGADAFFIIEDSAGGKS